MRTRSVMGSSMAALLAFSALPALAQGTPTLSIADISVLEGNSGTTTAAVTVTKSGSTSQFVQVSFDASDETAMFSDADYYDISGSLSFSPSETTETITVTIVGDTIDESDEAFLITLSNPNNATIDDGVGRVTIVDDDSPVTVSIGDTSVVEGDSGTQTATFTVSLSRAVSQDVAVSFATSDGTATFAGGDYSQASGTLVFAAGQTTRTINVTVAGDTADENDETFAVTLSNPNGVQLGDATGQATIVDDDGAGGGGGGGGNTTDPAVAISDQSQVEGDGAASQIVFIVTLSHASSGTVRVDYETVPGTAAEGNDYTVTSGQLVFAAGETSKTVSVPIVGDTLDEDNETFTLLLPRVQGATYADSSAIGTILDDDGSPAVSAADVSITEGDEGSTQVTLVVKLSAPSSEFVSVDITTADGTARFADADFYSLSGSIGFSPGEVQRSIVLTVVGDREGEPDEYFTVDLANPDGATIGDPSARITIVDDDVSSTSITLRVVKDPDRLVARGRVIPAASGVAKVSLFRKRDGRYVRVQTRRPQLVERADYSTYRTTMRRPTSGMCRVVARYPGSTELEGSSARSTFRC